MLQAAIIVVAIQVYFIVSGTWNLQEKLIKIYHVSAQLVFAHRFQLYWNISDFIFFYKITSL